MSAEFLRTARSLAADRFGHRAPALLIGILLLTGWTLWAFLSRVPVYVVSDTARLTVATDIHPVEAPVSGTIISSRMELGAEVTQGEVLAELDAELQVLRLAELRARLGAAGPGRLAEGWLASQMVDAYERLYREVLAEVRSAAGAASGS